MPSMNRKRTEVAVASSNSLIASAQNMTQRSGAKNYSRITAREAWQIEAWDFYHSIGEFRYVCDLVGSMVSKAILFATVEASGKTTTVETGAAADYIHNLFGNNDGKTEMLRLIGIHFTVAGECYIVSWPDPDNSERDVWNVASVNAVTNGGSPENPMWTINGFVPEGVNQSEIFVIRLWRPDPLDPRRAMAPTRALISVLGEIQRLTDHVAAQVDSRLAGAGILLMPSEMTFPAPPDTDGETRQANNAEDLMAVITKVMATSINDRGTASALVPIVITAPSEAIGAIKHMTFWSELDQHAIELRREAIGRLALGMDMPPEVLQGTAESNHWSAWQADESAIKAHTEPLLKIITSGLAEGYLRVMLEGEEAELDSFSIGVDTSEMRLRPNRSKEALELYDRGALSAKALLRETGFSDEDEATDDDRKAFLMFKLAQGSPTPEVMAAVLRMYGVEVPHAPAEVVPVNDAQPQPSLIEHPTQDIPNEQRSIRRKEARERGDVKSAAPPGLVAAGEQLVIRALERAGNRLKTTTRLANGSAFTAATMYLAVDMSKVDVTDLLEDAWAHVPPVAKRHNLPAARLTEGLESYCRGLLAHQMAHSYERFETWMDANFGSDQA